MTKKLDMNKIMNIVDKVATIALTIALIVCVLYTLFAFITEFGYTEQLGIYWKLHYSYNLGEYWELGEAAIRYEETHLNFYEIMKLIW